MDKSREQFLEWFTKRKIAMQKQGIPTLRIARLCQKQWEAWHASRAAVEIDVPDASGYWNGSQGQEVLNHRQLIADICDSIRAAGLKVKGE
ncbi:hypothetical protein ACOZ0V_003946 [Cronobacter malonaticus]